MAQVTFYVLPDEEKDDSARQVPAHIDFACRLVAQVYRQQQKVFIYTESDHLANMIDEHLWQFAADSFVAHNLQGEGPKFGTPVEIGCQPPTTGRAVLVNLSQHMPDFVSRFRQTFDFVPADELLKQQARERYKQYRAAGHILSTEPAA